MAPTRKSMHVLSSTTVLKSLLCRLPGRVGRAAAAAGAKAGKGAVRILPGPHALLAGALHFAKYSLVMSKRDRAAQNECLGCDNGFLPAIQFTGCLVTE